MSDKKKRAVVSKAQLCATNAVGQAGALKRLQEDLASLRNDVDVQVFCGWNSGETVYKVGKLFFVIAQAAKAQGIPDTTPDLRILESTCNALVEVGERQTVETLERHRASIAASLNAADRMLAQLSVYALGIGIITYEQVMAAMARDAAQGRA
jgi:hypothetical protein